MRAFRLAWIALGLLGASAASSSPVVDGCSVAEVKGARELQAILSRKAVEVVARAAAPHSANDPIIEQSLAPTATFTLGEGDVGLPVGGGITGATAFAQDMHADTFRYYNRDGLPLPVSNPCGPQSVKVEFIDTRGKRAYPITFKFEAGRIVSAEGWLNTFETGPIKPPHD